MSDYRNYIESWLSEIDSEIAFWDFFFRTKGKGWGEGYQRVTSPAPDFLFPQVLKGDDPSVLDVGSGPISAVGCMHGEKRLTNIVACDPLAPAYREILRKYHITPYVETQFCFVERLANKFGEDAFDVVVMRNALDHSFDALAGIKQLLHVTKTGGTLLLHHKINEAQSEGYEGFHQWNLEDRDGALHIWNREARTDVNELLRACAVVSNTASTDENGAAFITSTIQKTAPLPLSMLDTDTSALDEIILRAFMKRMSGTYCHLVRGQDTYPVKCAQRRKPSVLLKDAARKIWMDLRGG